MQDYLVVFNLGDKAQQVSIKSNGVAYEQVAGQAATSGPGQLVFDLPPYSYSIVRSTAAVENSMINRVALGNSYEENDRLFLPVEISFEKPEQLNLAKLSFYKHVDNGHKEMFAFDITEPYRAVVTPDVLKGVKKITIEATNLNGQTLSKTFEL
jgi:hypothetical protein